MGKQLFFSRIESLRTHARLDVAPFELEVLLRLVRGGPRAAVLARLQAPCALPDELGLRVVSLLVKLRLARERLGHGFGQLPLLSLRLVLRRLGLERRGVDRPCRRLAKEPKRCQSNRRMSRNASARDHVVTTAGGLLSHTRAH